MSDEQKKPLQRTLTQFVESNHKLISTFAILATLSVFANNLPDKNAARILSFLLFTLAILIGAEIVENCALGGRGKLYWFEVVFTLSVLAFGYVWVVTYCPLLITFVLMALVLALSVFVFASCHAMIRKAVSKISWFNNRSRRTRERLIPMFGAVVVEALIVVILHHFRLI